MGKSEEGIHSEQAMQTVKDDLKSITVEQSLRQAIDETNYATNKHKQMELEEKLIKSADSHDENEAKISLLEAAKSDKTGSIATADIAAAPASYDQAHNQTIIDLLNEIKAILNLMNQ